MLNLDDKCFGCQGCQDKVITDTLPSLVEKAAALSNYDASLGFHCAILNRTSSATMESYYDSLRELFTELPKMKAKNTLPSISPGHIVLSTIGTRELLNEPLMRKAAGEFDSYGRTILHISVEENWVKKKTIRPLI